MKYIADYLKEKGLVLNTITVHRIDVGYFYMNNRLFLIYNIGTPKDIQKINNLLSALSSSRIQEQLIEKIKISEKDRVSITGNIKSIFWDLYLLITYVYGASIEIMSNEDISKIERDKFIARKIIIQEQNIEQFFEKMNAVLFSENLYNDNLNFMKKSLSANEEDILSAVIDTEIETAIQKKLGIETKISITDLEKFLDKINSEYSNL